MNQKIILASTSIYRQKLFAQLGIPFEIIPSGVDENPAKKIAKTPEELVMMLSEAKAKAVALRFPDALIIGSDQCAAIGNRLLDKPGNRANALKQLTSLSGKTHRLLTGVYIFDGRQKKGISHLDVHFLHMHSFQKAQLQKYLSHDQPWDCAGSYRIEAQGIALFDNIKGTDNTAIVGLPLIAVVRMLRELGTEIFAL